MKFSKFSTIPPFVTDANAVSLKVDNVMFGMVAALALTPTRLASATPAASVADLNLFI
ncbi:hypothetical protein ROBYS_17870 [Roseobacter sp. OBYS 0001]|nr:hypothetical protein ROBYS_17870 [Roseobacter sp. OBYS 0001]